MSKKILLASTDSFKLYELIVRNLEFLGYEVVHIQDAGYPFRYSSIFERIENIARKIFLGDKKFKRQLREKFLQNKQKEILDQHMAFEFALVLRADFFDFEIIKTIRSKTNLLIGFHFDGVGRDIKVLDYVEFFDKFYVFDRNDVMKYNDINLMYSTNFYFDFPGLIPKKSKETEVYNVYYVSTYNESRVDFLIAVHRALTELFQKVRFVVVCNKHITQTLPPYLHEHMEIVHQHVSFYDQLQHVSKSELILDLVISSHVGFSFRIFEGLCFEKKVITTNPTVREADFYDEHNFFILEKDNLHELPNFLKLPYRRIDKSIVAKYSFTSWIDTKINNILSHD